MDNQNTNTLRKRDGNFGNGPKKTREKNDNNKCKDRQVKNINC